VENSEYSFCISRVMLSTFSAMSVSSHLMTVVTGPGEMLDGLEGVLGEVAERRNSAAFWTSSVGYGSSG
jgi:hypothetical protein